MNHYMVRYSDNYADEINIDGLCFITQEEKDLFFENLGKINFRFAEFSIGSNMEIYYERRLDVLRAISFEPISHEDYVKFKTTIGSVGFAKKFIGFIEDLADMEDDEDEEE